MSADTSLRPGDMLRQTDHRPYSLPHGSWVMRQTWQNLLFAHWPVPPEAVISLIPDDLQLDTYDGQAYIGVLPFRMTDVRVRGLPPIPGAMSMYQVNVRTYVRKEDKPGVYFLTLLTNHLPTVWLTRASLGLPYYGAQMSLRSNQSEWHIEGRTAPSPASLSGWYRPKSSSSPTLAARDSLEHWLVERYCLYTLHLGRLLRLDIHHLPWRLQEAEADVSPPPLSPSRAQLGVHLSKPAPLLHYAEHIDAVLWLPRIVT